LVFTNAAPVNWGISEWFIRTQILTYNIVFINFELLAPLMLPVKAWGQTSLKRDSWQRGYHAKMKLAGTFG
jgi:hypothetical protein